ncbi:MAG: T9SS type A sorting domain-containing protein [Prevotella sp.]|nr:T9SS type A sorting domain-containing protein [Prevotella sp.]
MKKTIIASIMMLLAAGATEIFAQAGSGVYVGGHIRRQRPTTVSKLKSSGFTYVILFNVNVDTNGDLTVDNGGEAGGVICRDGKYVFDSVQPYYAGDVKNLKTQPTGIERVEICIGGWGNQSYNNIKSLVNSEGTGETSILYRNFKALKEAIPEIDAVNNDDEHAYDVNSAVAFHAMMYELGYQTTVAPYTQKNYWTQLVTQLNNLHKGACDRVLIQCYDGGAYNNPSNWHIDNIPLHAGRTNYQTDMNTSIEQMQSWKNVNGVTGGFVWVYNDETWDLHNWATAMNRVFKPKQVPAGEIAATLYSEAGYGGYAVDLPMGEFYQAQLAAYGVTRNDIESVKLAEGYQIVIGTSSEPYRGTRITFTESSADLSYVTTNGKENNLRNRVNSVTISKIDDTAVKEIAGEAAGKLTIIPNPASDEVAIRGAKGNTVTLFDLSGRKVMEQPFDARQAVVDVSRLASGAYILRIGAQSGTFIKR